MPIPSHPSRDHGASAKPATLTVEAREGCRYELRFFPLSQLRCGYAFPCDALGHVAVDELSEHALKNFLHARDVVGRELTWPQVQPCV